MARVALNATMLRRLIVVVLAGLLGLVLGVGVSVEQSFAATTTPITTAPSGGVLSGLPDLRQAYVDEVGGLAGREATMRSAGASSEDIARALHGERRALGVKYKDLTPEPKLSEIYERNLEKYGDRLGPSIEYLRGRGKSWEDIIEAAKRPGGRDLDF